MKVVFFTGVVFPIFFCGLIFVDSAAGFQQFFERAKQFLKGDQKGTAGREEPAKKTPPPSNTTPIAEGISPQKSEKDASIVAQNCPALKNSLSGKGENPSPPPTWFPAGLELYNAKGEKRPAEELLDGSTVVALYFSAHHCPPCRHFTPKLKKFYEALKAEGANFEIVFVSWDGSAQELRNYYEKSHGKWMYLGFEDQQVKEDLSNKYGIWGIPTLIVIRTDGSVAVENARADVVPPKGESQPTEVWANWMKAYYNKKSTTSPVVQPEEPKGTTKAEEDKEQGKEQKKM